MEQKMSIEQVNRALQRKRNWAKAKKILANVFIYFVLVLMYAPLIYITVFSFSSSKTTGVWSNFTFDNVPKIVEAVAATKATKTVLPAALQMLLPNLLDKSNKVL